MLGLLLAKMISPKVLLWAGVAIVVGIGLYMLVSFINNYGALKQQAALLEQSVLQGQQALAAEKTAADQQHAIDLTDIQVVKAHDSAQAEELAQMQTSMQALAGLGKPTNADNKCLTSPYVSTILSRLRDNDTATPGGNSHPTSGATPAN